ncbi:MAG: DUF2671 domain-containing protein [Rickettsiales bacterium]|nr:DUF2671 domain-containing protein [Rickettsiales bacterium]
MANNQRLLNKLNLAGKAGFPGKSEGDDKAMSDMMSDARYLRQSSSLINEALQKGFDVLQLADGDIVMTGVKTVVYQYSWDEAKGKLVRAKTKKSRKAMPRVELEDFEEEEV